MPESVADKLHDFLTGNTPPPAGTAISGAPPGVLPSNLTIRYTPPPSRAHPGLFGNPFCRLHRPHQVSSDGVTMDTATCDHCAAVGRNYKAYFDKSVARYKGLPSELMMALACSESAMNPLAVARDDYDKDLAYGMMQIYHTHVGEVALGSPTAAQLRSNIPADIQKNIDAGVDIFVRELLHYSKHPDKFGNVADAIAGYKGVTLPGSRVINWNHVYNGGKGPTIQQLVIQVLHCYKRMIGASIDV